MAYVLQESYEAGADQAAIIQTVWWSGQTFTSASGFSLTRISLLLYKVGSPTGNITVSVYATAANVPTGAPLASVVLASSGLTTDGGGIWYNFDLSTPLTLTAATKYAIVVSLAGGNTSNCVKWILDYSSAAYTGGWNVVSTNSGGTWTSYSDGDCYFRTYSGVDASYVNMSTTGGGTGGGDGNLVRVRSLTATGGGTGDGNANLTRLFSLVATGGGTGGGVAHLLAHVMWDAARTNLQIVAVGNQQLWYEDRTMPGTMVELAAASSDIDTTDQLDMFGAYGKVFIANGANLKVADFQNTKIATTNIGSHPPDRGNILTAAGGAQMVVDYITTLSGTCTIYGYRTTTATFGAEAVTGTDNDDNAISFTTSGAETAPPHWYDWTVYGGDTTTYGSMPAKAYIGCLSGGRCVLSGNPDYPHQAPTSAAGNPWDWNIYRTTADRATVIGSGAAGQVGDVVRALIPARDGQLIIGCANSFHIMIDNPAYGGQMVDINGVGIFGARSWCFDGDGNLYAYATSGVIKIARGAAQIEQISQLPLPNLIADEAADPATHRITMGHDPIRQGIKICVTLLSDGSSSNYWLDLKTAGFFPDTHADDHGVYSIFHYDANDPDYKGLLLGCTDGYIRVHDDDEENDDGAAIDSYATLGPIPLAEDGRDGSIGAFDVVLAGGASGGLPDSGDVTMQVWTEDVAETLLEKLDAGTSPKLAMTFAGPGRARGAKRRRGVRGAYAGIKVGNDAAGETWGMEKIILDGGAPGKKVR